MNKRPPRPPSSGPDRAGPVDDYAPGGRDTAVNPHEVGGEVSSLAAALEALDSPYSPAHAPDDSAELASESVSLDEPVVAPTEGSDEEVEQATRELAEMQRSGKEEDDEVVVAEPPDYRQVRASRMFGRYELLLEMARGGMATIYLARIRGPEAFEKLLAIKTIHEHLADEPRFIQMFLDEARLAANIHDPNVVTLFEMGAYDGRHFLAMEYVHGQSVSDLLRAVARRNRYLPWPVVARIIAHAATGLHAAHELCNADGQPLSVVHRDVSPQNLLVSYDGHVKVVDFGIAYAAERLVHTRTGTLKGKVAYMSPEQVAQKPLDRRSDLFSLGIVLYEMICMRRLFRRDTDIATLQAVADPQIPRPGHVRPGIPTRLEAIILQALATDPEDRYTTGEALAEDLEALLVSENAVVTRRSVAQLMHQVFYEKKRSKDEQIRLAMLARDPEPMMGIGMDASGSAIEVPAQQSSLVELPPPRSRRLMIVAAGALALLAALGAGFLLSRSTGKNHGAPAPRSADARMDAAAPGSGGPGPVVSRLERDAGVPQVTIQVTILPDKARAEVVFRGRTYPGNVFREAVDRSSEALELEIRAPGFIGRKEEVRPTSNAELTFTLEPAAAPLPRDRPGPRRHTTRPRPPGMSGGLREPMW